MRVSNNAKRQTKQKTRAKTTIQKQTLSDAAEEFLAFKEASKIRERTLSDYRKYINKFIESSHDSLDVELLKKDILKYFAKIPTTSPARYNHPYQYLHAMFEWFEGQDVIPYNPFNKLELKKVKDEGNIQPAEIEEIQLFIKCLDKKDYCEFRDYVITLIILDTGIRTSEITALIEDDYNGNLEYIFVRPEVAKTSKSRRLYLSPTTNTALKKFLKTKPKEWEKWLFPTRDGLQLKSNVLARNFRKYCERSNTKFTPYQLRHSFATFYLKNGGDLFTLQKQMGHSDLTMTKRYTEISDEQVSVCHKTYSPVSLLQPTTRKYKAN